MMYTIKELQQSFDSLAPRYDSEVDTFHHHISFYVTSENLLRELPENRDIRILDSGGGTGAYSLFLAKRGYSVTLSDISQKSIDEAEKKAKQENITLKTLRCDSEHTGFEDASFDAVLLNGGVISYTPNPELLIRESYRILKPNGIIFFDFYNSLGWAIENLDPSVKIDFASSENRSIQMPDWDYPARIMSIDYVNGLLSKHDFKVISRYGLVVLSNSLPLDTRYSKSNDANLLMKYQHIELELSRRQNCVGAAWSCIFCAKK